MNIMNMHECDDCLRDQAAAILNKAFVEMAPEAWPTLSAAREEVKECLTDDRLALAAVVDGVVVGWIGGRPEYNGNVWELHPLAVHPDYQRQGTGRLLVEALEVAVVERGGRTLFLGSDDEMGLTSAAGENLYGRIDHFVRHLQSRNNHPFVFYQKLGFEIVGFVPDANGPGKPDILMAKAIRNNGSAMS